MNPLTIFLDRLPRAAGILIGFLAGFALVAAIAGLAWLFVLFASSIIGH